jgi:RNA polymerase sigma-70 factor (ECF subfamily)
VRDAGAAEDVQQQVFLEVWRRADEFDPDRGSLLTWIMTITRSRAIDHLRRRVPEPAAHDTLLVQIDAAAAAPATDALVEHWDMLELLRRLPDEEADVLRRRFYGDASQSQIAAETGIPLGTVKMRMVHGLQRLRTLMEEAR